MSDVAFHGNAQLKEETLARLRKHVADGRFFWNDPDGYDKGASIITCATEGVDDPQAFAEKLGYPVGLAIALNEIVNSFSNLEELASFCDAWLARTLPGADLSRVIPGTLVAILDDEALRGVTVGYPAIDAAREAVLALHRRALDGDTVERAEWKAARAAALAASEGSTDITARDVGAVAEAAAWPSTMRTVLVDTIVAIMRHDVREQLAGIGWTDHEGDSDENRVLYIMEAAHDRRTDLDGLDRVYAVLDEDHPEFGARFRVRIKQAEFFGRTIKKTGFDIVERLGAAPLGDTVSELD